MICPNCDGKGEFQAFTGMEPCLQCLGTGVVEEPNPTKRYLGDSVYVEINTVNQIVLTTDNGMGPSNTIYLEPEVWAALRDYVSRSHLAL